MSAHMHGSPGKDGEQEEDHLAPMPPIVEKVLEFDKASLDDPNLNDDKIFIKLWECLWKFTIAADEAI